MKELRKKTTITIFVIFSAILIVSLLMLNIRNYNRERESIEKNLNILENRSGLKDGLNGKNKGGKENRKLKVRELENTMIMDYEIYTVELDDSEISKITGHGYESEDFDAESIAKTILSDVPGDRIYIGNLYLGGFSYKYQCGESIVLLNNAETSEKLRNLLFESVIIFILSETILYFLSRLITGWLVTPAEKAFSGQKEFIADASHELKTPLAVIMASSDELDAATEESDPKRKYINNIKYEADRMNRLILSLLNLSRLEDGNAREGYKDEDLSRIIEKSCLAYEGVAFEQGVGIKEDIEENLRLKCSKDEIEKMISTILDNAVKHSFRDTDVRVSARQTRHDITIKIVNSGEPIKAEDKDKIFERFYRADESRNRSDNRYGLGLAIARQIALNHNGTITARSDGGDTTFEIVLKR
jgi:signal transduction histidine kinase